MIAHPPFREYAQLIPVTKQRFKQIRKAKGLGKAGQGWVKGNEDGAIIIAGVIEGF